MTRESLEDDDDVPFDEFMLRKLKVRFVCPPCKNCSSLVLSTSVASWTLSQLS